jgi:hypothetical protein
MRIEWCFLGRAQSQGTRVRLPTLADQKVRTPNGAQFELPRRGHQVEKLFLIHVTLGAGTQSESGQSQVSASGRPETAGSPDCSPQTGHSGCGLERQQSGVELVCRSTRHRPSADIRWLQAEHPEQTGCSHSRLAAG